MLCLLVRLSSLLIEVVELFGSSGNSKTPFSLMSACVWTPFKNKLLFVGRLVFCLVKSKLAAVAEVDLELKTSAGSA